MMSFELLSGLALRELTAEDQERAEAHVLACETCARELTALLRLGRNVRLLAQKGGLFFFVTAQRLEEMTEAGLVSRVYRLAPSASVACSVGPEDVFVAGVLEADLRDVERVDVRYGDVQVHEDVPFDRQRGVVVMLNSGEALRREPSHRMEVELRAGKGGVERSLGTYVFDHTA